MKIKMDRLTWKKKFMAVQQLGSWGTWGGDRKRGWIASFKRKNKDRIRRCISLWVSEWVGEWHLPYVCLPSEPWHTDTHQHTHVPASRAPLHLDDEQPRQLHLHLALSSLTFSCWVNYWMMKWTIPELIINSQPWPVILCITNLREKIHIKQNYAVS